MTTPSVPSSSAVPTTGTTPGTVSTVSPLTTTAATPLTTAVSAAGAMVPFSADQLEWIDRLIAGRVAATLPPPPATSHSLPAAIPTASSSSGAVPSFMPTFSVANSAALLPSAALVLTTPAGPSHLSSPPLTPPTPASSASIPGAALLPPKLVSKILRGEFIEMREMLPDAWVMNDQPTSCYRSSKPRRGGLITDIQLWVEGYASLVAVLTTEHPDKAPHFMAYLKTIVHASRNFEGSAWASYDAAYRRKAASTQSFDWAVIDSALYSEAFTGRARTLPRCRYCLSDTHHSRECPYSPPYDPAGPPPKVPRSSPGQPPRLQLSTGVELCGLFNRADGNQCRYRSCRYAHICAKCRTGPHPAADCGKQGSKTSRQTVQPGSPRPPANRPPA